MLRAAVPHWRWHDPLPVRTSTGRYPQDWPAALEVLLELTRGDSNVRTIGLRPAQADDRDLTVYVVVRETWDDIQKVVAIAEAYDSARRIEFRLVKDGVEPSTSLPTDEGVWLERRLGW